MKNLGYYNGYIDLLENLYVPLLDRACYFGDGVYDAAYSRKFHIYSLEEHVERFFNNAAKINIIPNIDKNRLEKLLQSLVYRLDGGENLVYWQVSRGTAERKHSLTDLTPNLWIMIRPASIKPIYEKVKIITAEDMRHSLCFAKTLNLLPNILASQEAEKNGCFECAFLRDGIVTECAHSNISILDKGKLITHPSDEYILAGVARAHLLKACEELGIKTEIRGFNYRELIEADEIIISASGSICTSVNMVDGKAAGGGDGKNLVALQDKLLGDFLAATEN